MSVVAIHAEAVAADGLWWVTDTGDLPVGRALGAPGALGGLLSEGVLSWVVVERGAVWTWLAEGFGWAAWGTRVRGAVAEAVGMVGWVVEDHDDVLGLVARDVVERQLAGFISSHGGLVNVVDVTAGVVWCELAGACRDCPAAALTLHGRIHLAVAARHPGLREVRRSHSG